MATGVAEVCRVAPPVTDALQAGRPVVALESTVITHGLPPPRNREVAAECEADIRAAGAVPATIAVRGGRILVGLDRPQLDELASTTDAVKASRATLAAALARGGWASTTVSATMIAAAAVGIRVFATGGIGGVHRGALGPDPTFDISADLTELGRTSVVVVCAGPKAILDIPMTMEFLETQGVPVVTVGADQIPGFYTRSSGVRSPLVAGDVDAAAAMVRAHLALGLGGGMLVCMPVPKEYEVPRAEVETAVAKARAAAHARHVEGPALTPFLLARIAERLGDAALAANVAVLRNNAWTAARLASALST